MLAACRYFLNQASTKSIGNVTDKLRERGISQTEEFFVGLGKMRAVIGQQLGILAYLYGVDIEEQLATILPPVDG